MVTDLSNERTGAQNLCSEEPFDAGLLLHPVDILLRRLQEWGRREETIPKNIRHPIRLGLQQLGWSIFHKHCYHRLHL